MRGFVMSRTGGTCVVAMLMLLGVVGCADDQDTGGLAAVGTSGISPNGSDPAACGNGACDLGENIINCRSDCEADDRTNCLATECAESWQACIGLEACNEALGCWLGCQDATCEAACQEGVPASVSYILVEVASCGAERCEAASGGAAAGDSCVGRCGQIGTGCSCDENCGILGDCCPDYTQVCVEGAGSCGDGLCDDAEKADGSCPEDCRGSESVCGDQICDRGEEESCPEDCRGGGTGGGDNCGDGICGGDEDEKSCPEDCRSGTETGNETVDCVLEACPEEAAECLESPGCANALECIADCGDEDWGCLFGCVQSLGFSGPHVDLLTCGQASGCVDGGGGGFPGGGGGFPGGGGGDDDDDDDDDEEEGCGDGVCNEAIGEQFWCPQDCEDDDNGGSDGGDDGKDGGAGTELVSCWLDACGSNVTQCKEDAVCGATLDCVYACPETGCIEGCLGGAQSSDTLEELLTCAGDAGC